jgi:hypothetical protein
VNSRAKGVNPKLLTAAQRAAIGLLYRVGLTRKPDGWVALGQRIAPITIEKLQSLGLAKVRREGPPHCLITQKGVQTFLRLP